MEVFFTILLPAHQHQGYSSTMKMFLIRQNRDPLFHLSLRCHQALINIKVVPAEDDDVCMNKQLQFLIDFLADVQESFAMRFSYIGEDPNCRLNDF